MTKLYFANPGEIDVRLTQLFGVNVKPNESAIGYFGTGLKYAIAVTLRLGGHIELWSGLRKHTFRTTRTALRGKDFELVEMVGPDGEVVQMPFTLELGKTWEPWMAYREFLCNARDEGGDVREEEVIPAHNTTVLLIECEELWKAHSQRQEFLLGSVPAWKTAVLELHSPPSTNVFYRGIKVASLESRGGLIHTYNVLCPLSLTEDRTIDNTYRLIWTLMPALVNAPKEVLEPVLCAPEGTWEHTWDWQSCFALTFPDSFKAIVRDLIATRPLDVNKSLYNLAIRQWGGSVLPPAIELSQVERIMLERAVQFCSNIKHPIQHDVIVVQTLGDSVLGAAMDNKIYLARDAFRLGTKQVAATLLEEHLHLTRHFIDATRPFQDYLLELAVTLGEEKMGEPL